MAGRPPSPSDRPHAPLGFSPGRGALFLRPVVAIGRVKPRDPVSVNCEVSNTRMTQEKMEMIMSRIIALVAVAAALAVTGSAVNADPINDGIKYERFITLHGMFDAR